MMLVWKCDWCGGSLITVNGQVQCELCCKWHGKDGKAWNINKPINIGL